MPVTAISWHDADAYARWRAERDGLPYRLATVAEWRRAAGGVDGRPYPWGHRFDPSLANVRGSRPGVALIATVDEFPTDVSVYGVRSMGGNGLEWTATATRRRDLLMVDVVGTSYRQCSAALAQIATTLPYDSQSRSEALGFRLACSLPPGDDGG